MRNLLLLMILLIICCKRTPIGVDEISSRMGAILYVKTHPRVDSLTLSHRSTGYASHLYVGRSHNFESKTLLRFSYPDTLATIADSAFLYLYNVEGDTIPIVIAYFQDTWSESDTLPWSFPHSYEPISTSYITPDTTKLPLPTPLQPNILLYAPTSDTIVSWPSHETSISTKLTIYHADSVTHYMVIDDTYLDTFYTTGFFIQSGTYPQRLCVSIDTTLPPDAQFHKATLHLYMDSSHNYQGIVANHSGVTTFPSVRHTDTLLIDLLPIMSNLITDTSHSFVLQVHEEGSHLSRIWLRDTLLLELIYSLPPIRPEAP